MEADRERELALLWKRSLSYWEVPPKKVLFQGREFVDETRFEVVPVPELLSEIGFAVSYAITGFNPRAQTVSDEENLRANRALSTELHALLHASSGAPKAVWASGSMDPLTGWGEPGFNAVFDRLDQHDQDTMLSLGRKYRQAALYRYTLDRTSGALIQQVRLVSTSQGVVLPSVLPCFGDLQIPGGLCSEVELAFLRLRPGSDGNFEGYTPAAIPVFFVVRDESPWLTCRRWPKNSSRALEKIIRDATVAVTGSLKTIHRYHEPGKAARAVRSPGRPAGGSVSTRSTDPEERAASSEPRPPDDQGPSRANMVMDAESCQGHVEPPRIRLQWLGGKAETAKHVYISEDLDLNAHNCAMWRCGAPNKASQAFPSKLPRTYKINDCALIWTLRSNSNGSKSHRGFSPKKNPILALKFLSCLNLLGFFLLAQLLQPSAAWTSYFDSVDLFYDHEFSSGGFLGGSCRVMITSWGIKEVTQYGSCPHVQYCKAYCNCECMGAGVLSGGVPRWYSLYHTYSLVWEGGTSGKFTDFKYICDISATDYTTGAWGTYPDGGPNYYVYDTSWYGICELQEWEAWASPGVKTIKSGFCYIDGGTYKVGDTAGECRMCSGDSTTSWSTRTNHVCRPVADRCDIADVCTSPSSECGYDAGTAPYIDQNSGWIASNDLMVLLLLLLGDDLGRLLRGGETSHVPYNWYSTTSVGFVVGGAYINCGDMYVRIQASYWLDPNAATGSYTPMGTISSGGSSNVVGNLGSVVAGHRFYARVKLWVEAAKLTRMCRSMLPLIDQNVTNSFMNTDGNKWGSTLRQLQSSYLGYDPTPPYPFTTTVASCFVYSPVTNIYYNNFDTQSMKSYSQSCVLYGSALASGWCDGRTECPRFTVPASNGRLLYLKVKAQNQALLETSATPVAVMWDITPPVGLYGEWVCHPGESGYVSPRVGGHADDTERSWDIPA
ncbi:hypothetical protein PAPYR_8033 [Paratrimastix pyriformis]|uniref:Uncharacterized protein n=1 Tax=Paratrimastix pyriformis TaxID=342808 RepID=A0ABQ8UBH6_9EUKA|nr:hypothetical protein PAPYR_8033 [Paratrimastix pyriformis]